MPIAVKPAVLSTAVALATATPPAAVVAAPVAAAAAPPVAAPPTDARPERPEAAPPADAPGSLPALLAAPVEPPPADLPPPAALPEPPAVQPPLPPPPQPTPTQQSTPLPSSLTPQPSAQEPLMQPPPQPALPTPYAHCWTELDDTCLLQAVMLYGDQWDAISRMFPYRTAAELEERWYSTVEARAPPPRQVVYLPSDHEVVMSAEARLLAARAEIEAATAAYEEMVSHMHARALEACRSAGAGPQPPVQAWQYIGPNPYPGVFSTDV